MEPPEDADPTAYVGLPLVDALARAGVEGWQARVLRPGSVVTMDYRPDRLSLIIEEDADEASAVVVDVRRG